HGRRVRVVESDGGYRQPGTEPAIAAGRESMTVIAEAPSLDTARRIRANAVFIGCGLFLAVTALAGIVAPWIVPNDPYEVNLLQRFAGFSAQYPLGTDHLGRCVLSRLLTGIRASLAVSFAVVALALLIGTLAGTLTALKGGWLDAVFMRICDMLLA